MTVQTLFSSLFQQKANADEELLAALNALDAESTSPAFQSALRVLNHAHMVDRIFIANLQRLSHGYKANWGDETPPFAQLSSDVQETDRWYLDYVSHISRDELEEQVDFRFTDGAHGRMSREEMLAHVITHSVYHRGQVGRLVPQVGAVAERDVFAGYLHRSDPSRRQS